METVSANDKENGNKRTKGRAGSVPPRATTPANGMYYPVNAATLHGGKSGVVTPAVRPASSLATSQSVPNKRPRLGDSTSNPNVPSGRAPLGSSRGPGINRSTSPTKIPGPGKTPGSSLPRPVPIAMPVPKPGTAHHALGHGRVPSVQQLGSSYSHNPYPSSRAVSYTSSTSYSNGRYGPSNAAAVAKKASRARRESFKPRPSMDENWATDAGLGGQRRWGGFAGVAVKEEDEEY